MTPIKLQLNNKEDRSDLAEKLWGLFTSEQAIANILHNLKVHIIQKLIPKGPHRPCHGDPILNCYMLPPPAIPRPKIAPSSTSLKVKEAINDPASILMCRLELDRIPLALVETQDPLVPVTEGEAIHLAETSFKHSGISINDVSTSFQGGIISIIILMVKKHESCSINID
ncbi:putative acetyl-hydrolase LipR [Fusarium oxysporum f. sp. albedinis]|nr:putative acetyl-hydrolase LipR [Fusarium oxysporum f. sp. albedinis]